MKERAPLHRLHGPSAEEVHSAVEIGMAANLSPANAADSIKRVWVLLGPNGRTNEWMNGQAPVECSLLTPRPCGRRERTLTRCSHSAPFSLLSAQHASWELMGSGKWVYSTLTTISARPVRQSGICSTPCIFAVSKAQFNYWWIYRNFLYHAWRLLRMNIAHVSSIL